MAFEQRKRPLLPMRAFVVRQLTWAAAALALVLCSLGVGAIGYRVTEDMSWLDAAHHAAMILTGMGPVTPLHTTAGKLFEIGFAIFSGVIFLTSATLLLAPIAHRVLHRFHLDGDK